MLGRSRPILSVQGKPSGIRRLAVRRIATILILTFLLASCSGAGDNADSTTTPPPPATPAAAAAGELDAAFGVGGHKLHLRCEGTASPGSPTIVYLHGLGGDGSDVESINTQLASQTRVCTYDRLNVGRSDSDPGRHTGADSVRDLHALLEAAGVPGPYLLVGFSFGGLLAIMYAGTHPTRSWGWSAWTGACPPTTRSTS
jgi:alpha-beta hydrolase superfamily lysophospholipase